MGGFADSKATLSMIGDGQCNQIDREQLSSWKIRGGGSYKKLVKVLAEYEAKEGSKGTLITCSLEVGKVVDSLRSGRESTAYEWLRTHPENGRIVTDVAYAVNLTAWEESKRRLEAAGQKIDVEFELSNAVKQEFSVSDGSVIGYRISRVCWAPNGADIEGLSVDKIGWDGDECARVVGN